MCICVCLYVYVYGSIVEPSGFRVLGFVVALGVPFNKQQLLSNLQQERSLEPF